MNEKKNYTEEELFEHGRKLLINGHRFSYIFRYLKERTDDAELIPKIIDRIKSDEQANLERTKNLQKFSPKTSYFNVIMGLFIMVFGIVIHKTLAFEGFIGTLPIALIVGGAGFAGREFIK